MHRTRLPLEFGQYGDIEPIPLDELTDPRHISPPGRTSVEVAPPLASAQAEAADQFVEWLRANREAG